MHFWYRRIYLPDELCNKLQVTRCPISHAALNPSHLQQRVIKGLISNETVVLRRWRSVTRKCGFISCVYKINWPPPAELSR